MTKPAVYLETGVIRQATPVTKTPEDPIVEEVRRIREAHAALHGFDLKKITEDLRRAERESGRTTVVRPPRKPEPIRKRSTA